MTIHQPTAAVRKSFGEAQQQAAAMVAGPPAPWNEAARAQRKSPVWLGVAAVSVLAGGVAGWLGVEWFSGSTRTAPPISPDAAARVAAPTPPTQAPAIATATTFAALPAPPSLAVTRQAGVIRIAASNASLGDAVRALAQATHTNVKGAEALASIASPVTLNWQGKDTAAAWDALLGNFASIAVSCSGSGCELWVVGVNAPRASTGQPVNASAAPTEQPTQVARPAVQAPPAPQGSDENTETN